jgi:CRISPR-associated protein Cas2
MLYIAYDFSDNKVRTKFAKFLSKYGHRVQYSVFEIKHSTKYLSVIKQTIKDKFEPLFTYADSVIIFAVPDTAGSLIKYGYPSQEDGSVVNFS